MFKPQNGPPHEGATSPANTAWRPIPIVQFDINNDEGPQLSNVPAGDLVWVEVLKRGHVVGVLETRTEKDRLPEEFRQRVVQTYADARTSFDEVYDADHMPSVTVIMPTICVDPDLLLSSVTSLLTLDYPTFNVVIVDNRPDPNRTALPDFPGGNQVRVVHEPRRGVSAARNRGIRASSGDLIAFTDDDVAVDQHWLRSLAARFMLNPEVDAIGGLVLPQELRTQPQLWFEEYYGGFSRYFTAQIMSMKLLSASDPMFPYDAGRFGAGCNMAVRRTAFERFGCFDVLLGTGTPALGGEDLQLFIKIVFAGGTVAFEPAAIVRHTHRDTEDRFMRQVFGYGAGLTAMYTSLIVRDPRHLVQLARRVPAGLQLLTKSREERSTSSVPTYPRRTYIEQIRGMAYGPVAYAMSVLRAVREHMNAR